MTEKSSTQPAEVGEPTDAGPGFEPGSLREQLKLLALDQPALLSPEEDAYLRHYGIHFTEEFVGLRHWFGAVDANPHRIAAHLWVPDGARGTAVVIHGYYDHAGLYGNLLRHLLDRGLAVMAFDLPGHGLSTGAAATIETFDHYVAAFDACIGAVGAHLPKPWVLLGQSTGGAVAMEWLLARGHTRETSPFKRVMLLAPLVRPFQWGRNNLKYQIARWFVSERPRIFMNNAENPEFLQFLRERDPLQARILPVQWVTAMVRWRRRFERYRPSGIRVLVVQGHADQTVDWRYNMKVVSRLFDARIFYIPEARHHLVNESAAIRSRIFQAIDGELEGLGAAAPAV